MVPGANPDAVDPGWVEPICRASSRVVSCDNHWIVNWSVIRVVFDVTIIVMDADGTLHGHSDRQYAVASS